MPDVAVGVFRRWILDPLDNGFGGVVLVGPEHHQNFVGFVEHNVFSNHRPKVFAIQKGGCKWFQFTNGVVVFLRPVKGLLEGLLACVGVVLGVHPVADHKELNKVKETVAAPSTRVW